MVFAGGAGTRSRPLTLSRPKALLPLLDVPLIDLALAQASPLGPVLVNVSHHREQMRRHLEGRDGVSILDEGEEPWGTAGTLKALGPRLGSRLVTLNCDLVSDIDLIALSESHREGSGITVAVTEVEEGADLQEGPQGLSFVDRRLRATAPGLRFLGASVIDVDLILSLPEQRPLGLAEALLQPAVERGMVDLFRHGGSAIDVGTPRRLRLASEEALAARLFSPPGDVHRLPGGERAYSGPDARVLGILGPGAVVLAGATVGPGAEVQHAVVFPGETLPPGEKLEAAILADGRRIPA